MKTGTRIILRIVSSLTAIVLSLLLIKDISAKSGNEPRKRLLTLCYGCGGNEVDIDILSQDIDLLTNKGYSPVFASEAIDAVLGRTELSEKSVMLCINGKNARCQETIYNKLKESRFKAVVAVNGELTEYASNSADDNTQYLRWEEIKELHSTNIYEFANAGYSADSDKLLTRRDDESDEHYRDRMLIDIDKMQSLCEKNCGFTPSIFVHDSSTSEQLRSVLKSLGFYGAIKIVGEDGEKFDISSCDRFELECIDRDSIAELEQIL